MIDWTDAFDNSSYVPGSDGLGERLSEAAQIFRDQSLSEGRATLDVPYGPNSRQQMDVFSPAGPAVGLVVFVHGGYWHSLDKSVWSHMAAGATALGWTVAIPSYRLAPEVPISTITQDVARAIDHAAGMATGPIRLIGHSAGGHLVARMMCEDGLLGGEVLARVQKAISVSGIHDLRPLLFSDMNETLRLTQVEAEQESPVLRAPVQDRPITFWVGARERPELLRQTRLIAEAWGRMGALVTDIYQPAMNHFTVIDGLADPTSALVRELTGQHAQDGDPLTPSGGQ